MTPVPCSGTAAELTVTFDVWNPEKTAGKYPAAVSHDMHSRSASDGHSSSASLPSNTSVLAPSRTSGTLDSLSSGRKLAVSFAYDVGDRYTQSAHPVGQEHGPEDVDTVAVIHILDSHTPLISRGWERPSAL